MVMAALMESRSAIHWERKQVFPLCRVPDPHAYAATPTVRLLANTGFLPRSLALDGYNIGDGRCGMII